jgi:hypothetical protein
MTSNILPLAMSVLTTATSTPKDVEASVALLVECCFKFRDDQAFFRHMVPQLTSLAPGFSAPSSSHALRNELARLFSQAAEAFLPMILQVGFCLDESCYRVDLLSL